MSVYFGRAKIVILALFVLALMAGVAPAAIIYVDNSLGTNGSGTSPADAVNNLQDAVTWSTAGDVLWITGGTYAEGVVTLSKQLTLAGGFNSAFNARDISGNPTIIDGQDVSRSVALMQVTADVHLDGLTVTGGLNDLIDTAAEGSAINVNGCSPTITSCTITQNKVYSDGSLEAGAIYAAGTGHLTVINCMIVDNEAESNRSTAGAAGIALDDSAMDATIADTMFLDNTIVNNCYASAFTQNGNSSDATLTNCVFAGNNGGFVAAIRGGSQCEMINCTIANNTASNLLRGTDTTAGTFKLTNCILADATAGDAIDQGFHTPRGIVWTLTNCLFHNNRVDVEATLYTVDGNNTGPGGINIIDGGGNISGEAPFFSAVNGRTWPYFNDPSSHDYTLTAGSVAVDAGTATGAPTDDIDGNARGNDGNTFSSGGAYDIGAYEFQSSGSWDDSQFATVYVKPGATGTGSDWTNAMGDLDQVDELISNATSPTVWVAAGTYTINDTIEDEAYAMQYFGGFPATGTPTMVDRDPMTNQVILQGDSATRDFFYFTDETKENVIIDGFIVEQGRRAIVQARGEATFRNCAFRNNTYDYGAIAIAPNNDAYATSISLAGCYVLGNQGGNRAAGIYCYLYQSAPGGRDAYIHCYDTVFAGNQTAGTQTERAAGAIDLELTGAGSDCGFIAERCVFAGNSVAGGNYGGAIKVRAWDYAYIRNCVFVGNTADERGGAVYFDGTYDVEVTNCTFVDNVAQNSFGGAVRTHDATNHKVVNCIFSGNEAATGGDGINGDVWRANNLFSADQDDVIQTASISADPGFRASTTGSFTSRVYDSAGNQTILTGSGFTPNALMGRIINPDTSGKAACFIVANTATQIVVPGDFSGGASNYEIFDLRLDTGSKAIDRGLNDSWTTVEVPSVDFYSNPRPAVSNNGLQPTVDIGAYEEQTATGWADLYVKVGGTGTGTSWVDACDIDYAATNAGVADIIWIAAGDHQLSTTWDLPNMVHLVGGFPATGNPTGADRDVDAYLSAIDGSDVVRSVALVRATATWQLDLQGMVFKNCYNRGDDDLGDNTTGATGGALRVYNTNLTINECTFRDNRTYGAVGDGGSSIYLSSTNSYETRITDSLFVDNEAIYDTDNTVTGNLGGAGIRLSGGGTVVLDNSMFKGNFGPRGASIYNWGSNVEATNTAFIDNVHTQHGSGLWLRNGATATVVSCTFSNNDGPNGPCIYVWSGSNAPCDVTVLNTIFANSPSSNAIYSRNVTIANVFRVGNSLFDNNNSDAYGDFVDLGGNISGDTDVDGSPDAYTFAGLANPLNGNVNLVAGSAAIDTGASSSGYGTIPSVDMDGNARDVDMPGVGGSGAGNAYDIGAIERVSTAIPSGGVVYVNDNAADGGDGTLAAPIKSIQNAIDLLDASPPAPWNATTEVYVAGGTYYEHLLMEPATSVRGGFSEDFSSRDASANPTIVDGENTPFSGALVRLYDAAGAKLDGFTIQNGYNNIAEGGGVYVNCQAEITSCVITRNLGWANWLGSGGGVRATGSADALIANCRIHHNNVMYVPSNNNNDGGGGICVYGASANVTVLDSQITSNSSGRGGGIMCAYGTAVVKNSVIAQNMVRDGGTAAFIRYGGDLSLINCTVDGNYRRTGSTVAIYQWDSTTPYCSLTAVNTIFSNNYNYAISGNSSGNHTHIVANCLFHNNGGRDVAGVITDLGGNISKYTLGSSATPTAVFYADRAALDYLLMPGSHAVDAGLTTDTAPTWDIAGNARDYDVAGIGASAPDVQDIGAYELRTSAMPEGIFVDDSAAAPGSGTKANPFLSIGDGLDATETGSSWPNLDSVNVAGGTYPEIVDMQTGITIRGGFAADFASRDLAANASVIDGEGVSRGNRLVEFNGDHNARLEGMTVYNNRYTGSNAGGILLQSSTGVMITSCTVDSNRVHGGYLSGGGGIGTEGTGSALIDNCTITSNSTYYVDSRWPYQYPGNLGGGMRFRSWSVDIRNSVIAENLSASGAGIGIDGAAVSIDNTIIHHNNILQNSWIGGGAIGMYNRYGDQANAITTVTNCTIAYNGRIDGAGTEGIRVYVYESTDWTTFTLANSIVANHATQGFYCGTNRATYAFVNNLFHDNGDDMTPNGNVLATGNISRDGNLGGQASAFTSPLFADAANGDFSPLAGSAAIDKGLSSLMGISATPTDINGNARDYDVVGVGGDGAGNAYDIGAIENQTAVLAATTIHVDDDAAAGGNGSVGAPFQTINEGLDVANPEWLMDIRVAGGLYYETVDMTPGLTMTGGYSSDFLTRDFEATASMIDGQKDTTTHTRALVWFKGGDAGAWLDGFTIQNNRNAFGDWEGGAISVEGGDAIIMSCTMQGNFCLSGNVKGGGGVFMSGSAVQTTITNCTFFNNFVMDQDLTKGNDGGGAVIVYAGADMIMSDCMITSNRAGRGGGIYVRSDGSTANVYNTVIGGNVGWNSGGALWFRDDATARFVNCTISGNLLEGGNSYGVYYWGVDSSYGPCSTVFINNIFEGHANRVFEVPSSGVAHYIELRNNLFDRNGDDYYGPAVDVTTNNITTDTDIGGTAGTNTNAALMVVPGQNYSYIVMVGSQAIDNGLSVADVPAADILGFARDASPDIGAVEYDSTPKPPEIVVQPASLVLDPGDTDAIFVSATGSPLLHYQWEFNDGSGWVNVGVDGYQLAFDPADESHEGSYRVTVTNDYGAAVSDVVTVTVNDPPVITVEPVSVHTTLGGTASFSVTVTGATPMTYQWQKDGGVVTADATHVITSGASGSTLDLTNVLPTDVGVYRVQISNSAGLTRSVYVTLTIDGPVQILKQPTTQTTAFGSAVEFSVYVSGTQPMTYAWSRNSTPLSDGGNISGSASNVLTVDPVGWADALGAGYQVKITNSLTPAGLDSVIVGIRLLPTGVSPWWEMMK